MKYMKRFRKRTKIISLISFMMVLPMRMVISTSDMP